MNTKFPEKTIVKLDSKGIPIIVKQDNCEIELPKCLYKSYALTGYSVEALTEHYLYAAKPEQLNDIYDCSPELFTPEALESCSILSDYKNTDPQPARFYTEPTYNYLERYITDNWGIISLNERYKSTLMWSHYVANDGFIVTFNPEKLKGEGLGPYPIQYLKERDLNICKTKYQAQFIPLVPCFQKKYAWHYEKEWRILANVSKCINERKYVYDVTAVKAIHVGYYFLQRIPNSNIHFSYRRSMDDKDKVLRKLSVLRYCKEHNLPIFVYVSLDLRKTNFPKYHIEHIDEEKYLVIMRHG